MQDATTARAGFQNKSVFSFTFYKWSVKRRRVQERYKLSLLDITAEAEARGIARRVRRAAGNVTQSERFADTCAAAARVAGTAADGI